MRVCFKPKLGGGRRLSTSSLLRIGPYAGPFNVQGPSTVALRIRVGPLSELAPRQEQRVCRHFERGIKNWLEQRVATSVLGQCRNRGRVDHGREMLLPAKPNGPRFLELAHRFRGDRSQSIGQHLVLEVAVKLEGMRLTTKVGNAIQNAIVVSQHSMHSFTGRHEVFRSAQRIRFKLQKPSGARFLSASNLCWAAPATRR